MDVLTFICILGVIIPAQLMIFIAAEWARRKYDTYEAVAIGLLTRHLYNLEPYRQKNNPAPVNYIDSGSNKLSIGAGTAFDNLGAAIDFVNTIYIAIRQRS